MNDAPHESRGGRGTVVLLTDRYPFGHGESFLNAELPVLARGFERVIVVPSQKEEFRRGMPSGVECETFLTDVNRRNILRELVRHPMWAAWQYGRAIVEERRAAAYLGHLRTYLGVLGLNMWKYRLLKDFIQKEELQEALFYDYWLTNSTLALSRLRRKGIVRRAVARAHGVDLYEEQSEYGAVPFQAFNVSSVDQVFAISEHGLSYLAEQHPRHRKKVVLSRLGVERQPHVPKADDSSPLVVSCAFLVDLKRVHLIPDVLSAIGRPLRWVHFGDGPTRFEVERTASALPEGISWRLAGDVDHADLLNFYRSNNVRLFVSFSSMEGLPVSIMEAISFGIPILATGVGGVPEIVSSSTGRLVGLSDSPASIAQQARELLDGVGPTADDIVAFSNDNFDAETNFGRFVDTLRQL